MMRGLIKWVVHNSTIVNLLMVGLCLMGFMAIEALPKETFPESSLDIVFVRVIYRGASPKEVENGILIKIEEALQGVTGISEIKSEAKENLGLMQIEVAGNAKTAQVLRDIKDQIDQITSFPKDADKPSVFELIRKVPVGSFALYGDLSRASLQTLADKLRDDLLAKSVINYVNVQGKKEREISIELEEEKLRKYNLQISDVSRILASSNFDLSGGMIKTAKEDFMIRIYGKKYTAKSLENIVIRNLPGGNSLRIRDIGKAVETFADTPQEFYFNGKNALLISVMRTSGGNSLKIIKQAKAFVKEALKKLPKNVHYKLQRDRTIPLKSRISLLVKNGLQGLVLVLITLTLLMNVRLAFWVAAGLPIAMLGTFILFKPAGLSINVLSLFGLILVIGILVDDAIVIAENVYSHLEKGKTPVEAAIDGTVEVMPAVFAAVSTTILAFTPLFFMGGIIGKFIYAIPAVVCLSLLLSLVEGFLILPPHLAHSLKPRNSSEHKVNKFRDALDKGFLWFNNRFYAGLLRLCLKNRWAVLALGIAMFLSVVGLMRGGVVKFVFFPRLDGDQVVSRFTMAPGTPKSRTREITLKIERAGWELAKELKKKYKRDIIMNSSTWIGKTTLQQPGFSQPTGEEIAEVQFELLPSEKRGFSSFLLVEQWRKKVGAIIGASSVTFDTLGTPPLGRALEFQLLSQDNQQLRTAANFMRKRLASYQGVSDAETDMEAGKRELRLKLTPLAKSLGVTLQEIALQIRYRITGQEVMRLQRGRDEVRVFVRYPVSNRNSLKNLEELWIRTRQRKYIPLSQLATWSYTRQLKVIRRIDRKRMVTVFANLDNSKGNRDDIVRDLRTNVVPKLHKIAPQAQLAFAGQGKEQAKVFGGMKIAFPIAIFAIFVILVTIFRSYTSSILILSMIPFGLIGAVLGHLIVGFNLTILSFFGIVGLSGIVVNDSLVLMDKLNSLILEGNSIFDSAWLAGQARLRAIISTTITTFVGLFPLILEKSLQAQFLIPMAISIGFGVVFATFITLIMIPSFYLLFGDVRNFFFWMKNGRWPSHEETDPNAKRRRDMLANPDYYT